MVLVSTVGSRRWNRVETHSTWVDLLVCLVWIYSPSLPLFELLSLAGRFPASTLLACGSAGETIHHLDLIKINQYSGYMNSITVYVYLLHLLSTWYHAAVSIIPRKLHG